MAESSIFWPTNGTGDGATNYTADDMQALFRRLFMRNTANEGVVSGWLNEMQATATASPITVNTGAAFVYGIPYENNTTASITVPVPATMTRYDYLVLRADWTAQTVRLARLQGVEGGGMPTITQTAGVVWEVPIYSITATTGGAIILGDIRSFCRPGFGFIPKRNGGSNTNWATPTGIGSVARPSKPSMQAGASYSTPSTAASGTYTIGFPNAFDYAPLVIATVAQTTPTGAPVVLRVPDTTVTASQAAIEWETTDGSNLTYVSFNWIAIGTMS